MKKGVSVKYIDIIKNIYDGVVVNIRSCGDLISNFSFTVGLHEGSAWSIFLFTIIMDDFIRAI